ncbi:YjjG family noncanonical pyrimidine nucleotidase [Flavobacterium luteum]|uniref:Noncanonical pyrimidine nucleotidase, YjjG family n=1 Tax=Flavobacterium luteum TaxID=2026654 RepID=A0A7J5ADS4_9FLAO|nr:YjjG family noncanonical pyrimidine nucleotidase [Flavobacterium luteum]KAB1155731.1 noncanonical pyrimidine nucleotidase, YjjG family [Flavobacterium luteum]
MKTIITDVFFDLDHTLWDFEKNSALAFETIFKNYQIEIDLDKFLKHYIPINLKYWEMYRMEQITQIQLRFGRLKDTFDLIAYEIEDEKINLLSDKYIHYLPKYNHLFEGTIEILEYLRPKYKLHIITNGFAEIQNNKLNNANISHYFQTITNSEMAGVKKPNPIIFEHALDKAQAKKESSIMIGDCLEADIYGAIHSGFEAILFNEHKKTIPENIKQVHHLLQLKKHL